MILTKSARKEFNVDSEIYLKTREGNLNSLLMIVPTNRRIRVLQRDMISQSPGLVTGKLNLETIGTVSSKILFNSSSIRTNIVTDAAASVLLQQCFSEVKLKYFSSYNGEIPSGTVERIRNVIAEYKRHGTTSDKIRKEAETLSESEKNKAFDIANVFEKYQSKLNSLNLKETGDIYSALIQLDEKSFLNNFNSLYPDVNLIIIMGFDEFTLPEVEIINRLSGKNKSELFLSFDYYKYNPLVFSHLDNCYNNFLAKGFREIPDKSFPSFSGFQNGVRENLFSPKNKTMTSGYKDRINFISGSTREKEIELIASTVKELILNEKVQPEKICVVFNLINNYSDIVRDIFPLYGLPFNLTDRFHLFSSSPVVSVLSFLEIAENDFYYKNIFRALSGGILEIEGINLTNLLGASIKLKIISGFDNWQKSLNDAIVRYEESEEDSYDIVDLEDSYKKALNDINRIHDYLNSFLHKMNIPGFRESLNQLMQKLKLPVKLLSGNPDEVEKNIKSVHVFSDTADEILSLLEEQFGKEEKFPVSFFLHNIRMAVSSTRFNIKEKPGYGVQVTTMNEIRGLMFDYLFIAGLCDGDFPTKFAPEIFFSGTMARNKGEQNHITEERYLFYQSLCAWKKGLYFTYPRKDERKEFVQSDFLHEFMDTFEVSEIEENQFKNKIYTNEQLLTFIGKNGIEKADELIEPSFTGLNREEIKTAMEIDKARNDYPFAKSVYAGYMSDELSEEGMKNLLQMKDRQFSISQLEIYAKCPYKYFAERVLKLNILEEPTEEIEALEIGSLLHTILFNFYTALKKDNVVLNNCSNEQFKKAEKLLFKIAETKVNEVNFNSPLSFFEREKIFGIDGNKKNSILYKFLIAERENEEGYIPEFFEAGFGKLKEEHGQRIVIDELRAGEIKVRGKIDRIDINPDEKTYKVFDYKTGKSPLNKQDISNGLQLQLPLYLYAAKEIIKAEINEEYEPAGALIYSLKYNEEDFGRKELGFGEKISGEELTEKYKELIRTCLEAINKYVNGISNGDFRLSQIDNREEKACKFCGFKPICRVQEVKTQ